MKKQVDIGQITDNMAYFKTILKLYGDPKNFPPDVAANMKKLMDETELLAHGEIVNTDMSVLNGSNVYFANPKRRRQEISSSAGIYGLGAKKEEGAFSFMVNYLEKNAAKPENLIEKVNILSQLFVELLQQNPSIVDLRALPIIQEKHRLALDEHRVHLYQSMIAADWALVKNRFDKTGEFYFDLVEFKVYPIVLNIQGGEALDFKTKPGNQIGEVISFEKAEDAVIQATQAEYRAKNQTMTFTHLKAVNWNSGAYSSSVENELYLALKNWVNTQIETFKQTHGGDVTKVMLIKANENKYTILGGNDVYLGYKIELNKPK